MSELKRAVLVDGLRTPFLNAAKSIPGLTALRLGTVPVNGLLTKYYHMRDAIDSVVGANVGNQLLPPDGSNITRIIAMEAGIPKEVDARTININCGSGLEAIIDATMRIEVGLARCVLVSAVEVMSDYTAVYKRRERQRFADLNALARSKTPMWRKGVPLAIKALRTSRMEHDPQWLIQSGLTDPMCGLGMDKIADNLAKQFNISRKECDLFALQSQQKAAAAQKSGRLSKEVIPVELEREGRSEKFDNGVRAGQTVELLAKLRPLNVDGTTTPGNSSQISDGAVALIVADEEFAHQQGWPCLARVRSEYSAVAGCAPSEMGLGPVAAIKKLFRNLPRWTFDNLDLIETNEAFASVVLAQSRVLGNLVGFGEFPWERTNINGGAIALGHPVGASGARLALTAAMELQEQKLDIALVTACIGGGQGIAAILERP